MYVPLWALESLEVALGACAVGMVFLGSRALGADEVARWAHEADERARRARADLAAVRLALGVHPCSGAGCDAAARARARIGDIIDTLEG